MKDRIGYCFSASGNLVPMASLCEGEEFFWVDEGPVLRWMWMRLPWAAQVIVRLKPRSLFVVEEHDGVNDDGASRLIVR